MPCPTDTTLNCFCVGGQIDPACCDEAGNWPALRVVSELVTTQPGPILDPTNCAIVTETRVIEDLEDTNGCWCTCPLKPNFHPENPDLALQPSGSYWKVTVQADNGNGSFSTVLGPIEVQLDASLDMATLDECCTIDCPTGDTCINIVCLMDPPATDPPTNRFCEAVQSCLSPITGAGLLNGGVVGNYLDGWVITLTCEDIAECIPTPYLQGLLSGGIIRFGTDLDGILAEITVMSADPGQLIVQGADGGLYMDAATVCGAINATCPATAVDNGDGTYTVTGTDGNTITFCGCGDITDNGDGTYTWTAPDGTTVTWDVNEVIVSADADNVITIGSDGGALLTAADICVALNATCPATVVDNGDGTYTITGTDGSTATIVGDTDTFGMLVDNGDQSYTWTSADGVTSFTFSTAEVIVSADAGNILADGTDGGALFTAQDVCDAVNATCPATAVINPDGSLSVTGNDGVTATFVPAAETVTSLVDNGDGSFTYINEAGTPTTVDMNDLTVEITDLTIAGSVATFTKEDGSTIVMDICAIVNGNCPATAVDNGNGSYTITGTDGSNVTIAGNVDGVIYTLSGLAAGVITLTGTDGSVQTVTVISGDADNLLSAGADGGVTFTAADVCAAVNANCPGTAVDNGDGTYTITGTDGSAVTITGDTFATVVDNGDGTYTYTSADGVTVITWDTTEVVVSADAGNLLTVGTDDGALLTAADVCAAVNGSCPGTAVDNGDGTFTVTGTDGSTITFAADTDSNTTYAMADNADGSFTLTGSDGSTVTIGACDLLDDLPSTGAVIPGGVSVLGSDCQFHLLPAGTTDSFTTFVDNGDGTATFTSADGATALAVCTGPCNHMAITEVDNGDGTITYTATAADGTVTSWTTATDTTYALADNADGSFTLTGSDGSTVTISACDLIDDITQVGSMTAGALVVAFDPVGGTCELAPLPAGTTDSFTTFVDNGDGTGTFTSADGATTLDVCLTPCTVDTNTTYTLTDNGDGTFSLIDDAGTVISTVTFPADTDTFTTFVDNGDGTATFTSADGTTTIDVCVAPCITYDLVDNGDGSISLNGSDGSSDTIALCDLVDDVTQQLALSGTALVLNFDPATGECGLAPVSATAPPCIQLIKSTTDDWITEGETVTYQYQIHNCGTVDLTSITLTDDVLGTIDTSGIALPLTPGSTATVTGDYVTTAADVTAGIISNIATVTGEDAAGQQVSAVDTVNLSALQPVKACGLLTEELIEGELVMKSGDLINTSQSIGHFNFVSATDGLIATGTTELTNFEPVCAPDDTHVFGDTNQTTEIFGPGLTPVYGHDVQMKIAPSQQTTDPCNYAGNGPPPDRRIVHTFDMIWQIQDQAPLIGGCSPEVSGQLWLLDFDASSFLDNLSTSFTTVPGECDIAPVEVSTGRWQGQEGGNCALYLTGDSGSYSYEQSLVDTAGTRILATYRPAVCVWVDPRDGTTVVSADTVSGPVAPADFGDIELV